jgi:hypothetical protein
MAIKHVKLPPVAAVAQGEVSVVFGGSSALREPNII